MRKLLLGTFLFGLVAGLCPQSYAKGANLICKSTSGVETKKEKSSYIDPSTNQVVAKDEESTKDVSIDFNLFLDAANNLANLDGEKAGIVVEPKAIKISANEKKVDYDWGMDTDYARYITIDRASLNFKYKKFYFIKTSKTIIGYTSLVTEASGQCTKIAESKKNKI